MKGLIRTSNSLHQSARRFSIWVTTAWLMTALTAPLLADGGNQDGKKGHVRDNNCRPHIVRPDSRPFGHTYGEWASEWWEWALAIPADDYHPLKDQEGDYAARCQSGPVWFLGGVLNKSGTATRHVTVPTGKALFFPVLNVECSTLEPKPYHGDNEAQLRARAEGFHLANLSCEIDGWSVGNLTDFESTSPLFDFSLPANNILRIVGGGPGQAVDHGVYLMLAGLCAGEHTIHFRGMYPDSGCRLDITHHLTVEDPALVSLPHSCPCGPTFGEPPGDLELVKPDKLHKANQAKEAPPRGCPRTLAEARERKHIPAGETTRQDNCTRQDRQVVLDVKGTPFGQYDTDLIEAVEQCWHCLLGGAPFPTRSGEVVLEFRLHCDGCITSMKTKRNEVGEPLEVLCEGAILRSAPFPKWPAGMRRRIGNNYREIIFTFYYN